MSTFFSIFSTSFYFILLSSILTGSLCIVEEIPHADIQINQGSSLNNLPINSLDLLKTNLLWPFPKYYKKTIKKGVNIAISPCQINYQIQSSSKKVIQLILDQYLNKVFNCSTTTNKKSQTLFIFVKNSQQFIATKTFHQRYTLDIKNDSKWILQTDYYVGFLRAIQTFFQLFQSIDQQNSLSYQIRSIPILIKDQPQYIWRGIMIDSARHFLPKTTIIKLINGMMFNKMNILHWHIVDQDSFPMQIKNRPQLSEDGSFGKVYTFEDIRQVIQYAKIRGVRVIPQIDTPAHTQSWGRSQKLKQIVISCHNLYVGQFDPTLNLTYQVVEVVMKYVNSTFDDDYVHFGGDQVQQKCFQKKKSISQWMKINKISDYKALSIHYRKKQKKIWRSFSKKKVIYWANEKIDLPLDEQDVIHWWSQASNMKQLQGRKNQVILSNTDLTYLDKGFGSKNGNDYKVYQTWKNMYQFSPKVKNVNVIGGQACMWSEICNQHNIQQKIWMRSSVIGQRLWNSQVLKKNSMTEIAQRLVKHGQRMKKRGFKVSSIVSGICQNNISYCSHFFE